MSNIKSIISTASLYIMFGVWSFIHMMEYKYFTRIEQYDSIVDNMDRCNKKYTELVLKMIHMENRIAELEDILYITDELSLSEEVAPEVVEVEEPKVLEVEATEKNLEPVASLETVVPKVLEETTVAPKVLEETTVASSNEVVVEEMIIKIEAEPKVEEVESVTSLEVESVTSLEVESVTSLEVESVISLEVESVISLEVEPKVLELVVEVVEESTIKVETTVASLVKEETKAVDNFDAGELVDLSSEEKETNSNKKGWVKTLLFL